MMNVTFERCFVIVALFSGSDCILHGYIKKLGGPFASAWQTKYAKLYPNRLELHPESATKPELIFLDQVSHLIPILCLFINFFFQQIYCNF